MAATSSSAASSDPNFPPSLSIAPSNRLLSIDKSRSDANGGAASAAAAAASWDQDTAEDIEAFGIAGRIWEAAYLLRLYLQPSSSDCFMEFDPPTALFLTPTATCSSSNIIELGSGAGYVGLHFARQLALHLVAQSQPASASVSLTQSSSTASPQEKHINNQHRVVLTDLDNVCPLLERNAQRAGFAVTPSAFSASVPVQKQVEKHDEAVQVLVRPLPWGSTLHATRLLDELYPSSPGSSSSPNLTLHEARLTLLCSDLVYFPALLAPLLRTLIILTHEARSKAPVSVVLAYKIRSLTKEEAFWRAFGAWFEWTLVRCRPRRSSRARQRRASQSHGGAEERTEAEWERFGRLKWHLEGTPDYSSVQPEAAEEEAEDEYFLLSCVRRADSLGATAPPDDAKLMSGFRARSRSRQKHNTTNLDEQDLREDEDESFELLEQGAGGEEFELMLMRQLQSY